MNKYSFLCYGFGRMSLIERKRMSCWQTSVETLTALTPSVVHVWRLPIEMLLDYKSVCFAVLSACEKERALNYRFERDKNCYLLSRGILRYLLAEYTSVSPSVLRFKYKAHGKPVLANSLTPIHFNVSHTQTYATIAISLSPVGIDIESYQRHIDEILPLAKRFFSTAEYLALSALPVEQQQKGFVYAWTTKEAWVKALGTGIADNFPYFDVNVDISTPPNVIRAEARENWSCWPVAVGSNHYGALVTDSKINQIAYYDVTLWAKAQLA